MTDKTQSQAYHWEQDGRKELLDVLEIGLAASGEVYVPNLLDTFSTVRREDHYALLLQHTADRIVWRAGFEQVIASIDNVLRARRFWPRPIPIQRVF
jgi:hypothetical protein